jgi:hypothetical protein
MSDVDTVIDSPFHSGEQQMQERLGVRDVIEPFARRAVRDHMPDQHRDFYAQLPFVLIGSVDDRGRPWASLVARAPGFMSSPDGQTLDIATRPLAGDPLNETLRVGADIGLLGIEPAARRRNRLTARVGALRENGFTLDILQTFGNCPQYIQTRDIEVLPPSAVATPKVTKSEAFDDQTRALIEQADTLFIATAYRENEEAVTQGADVSHRGGRPGFVRVEDEKTFVFPDFSGNNNYNTIGNILLNPRAGFLFVDFESRDLVYMTGSTEIVWDGEEVEAFAGAERLLRFRAEEVIRVAGSLPLQFAFGDYSPQLNFTGTWDAAAETLAAKRERNAYLPYEVAEVSAESDSISSFLLRRADGKTPAAYEQGQFLPIRMQIPGTDSLLSRTYTLSDAPGEGLYRLSIEREDGPAVASKYLHENSKPGFQLEAMAPRGKFVLDQSSDRPVVLLSAGVGITPMIAMMNFIIKEGHRTRGFRRTYFIYGTRNGGDHAFGAHVREIARLYDNVTAHVRYSRPNESDRLGAMHDSEGHIDVDMLKAILPFDDYDFYLCGPGPFMQSLYEGLVELGVRDERIHYESFGPAVVLKPSTAAKPESTGNPVAVRFAASKVDATWSAGKGTLLELAEDAGLNPAFSCRSGVCGTCATRLKVGAVDYVEEPGAPHADDEVLICCATPQAIGDSVVLNL